MILHKEFYIRSIEVIVGGGGGGKKVGKNPRPHQFLGIKHLWKADEKPTASPQPFWEDGCCLLLSVPAQCRQQRAQRLPLPEPYTQASKHRSKGSSSAPWASLWFSKQRGQSLKRGSPQTQLSPKLARKARDS